jgi:hypothetical protein
MKPFSGRGAGLPRVPSRLARAAAILASFVVVAALPASLRPLVPPTTRRR